MNMARERAVVLGGSMAGTLAARVLSESFSEVLVVDRDDLVGVQVSRRGTHTRTTRTACTRAAS